MRRFDCGFRLRVQIKDLPSHIQQVYAGRSQRQWSVESLKKHHIQILLQVPDRGADSRLTEVKAFGGFRHREGLTDRHKDLQ